MIVVMDTQQPMPAPPPYQPVGHGHDPYEFITNPGRPAKKSLLGSVLGGNSAKGRLIIAAAGVVILLFLVVIAYSFITSGNGKLKQDYQSLAQQQAEIIRVSEIGVSKAKQTEAKNLAVTTKYTLTSQQPAILSLAKKAGAKTDAKTLILGKDNQTDSLLTTADQTNQFDTVFIKTLQTKLQKYQQALKKIYDASSKTATKDILTKDYDAVTSLIGSQPIDGGSSGNPATN